MITQREPYRHYKPTVFRYKVISVNRTVPKAHPFSVFIAVKDGKRSDFLKRYGSRFNKNGKRF